MNCSTVHQSRAHACVTCALSHRSRLARAAFVDPNPLTMLPSEQASGVREQPTSAEPSPARQGQDAPANTSQPPQGAAANLGDGCRGCLLRCCLSLGAPTNHEVLLIRFLSHQLIGQGDQLAGRLSSPLMPIRSWFVKRVPGAYKRYLNCWGKLLLDGSLGPAGDMAVAAITARTLWLDGLTNTAVASGIEQVVILGAGFDTRAYRTVQPGSNVMFYEIDLPTPSQRKQQLVNDLQLVPTGVRTPIYMAADLSKVDLHTALLCSEFDTSKPTLFLMEGLLPYLPPAGVLHLLASISILAAPGSLAAFDHGYGFKTDQYAQEAKMLAWKGEPLLSDLPNTADGLNTYLDEVNHHARQLLQDQSGKLQQQQAALPQERQAPAPASSQAWQSGRLVLRELLTVDDVLRTHMPSLASGGDKQKAVLAVVEKSVI